MRQSSVGSVLSLGVLIGLSGCGRASSDGPADSGPQGGTSAGTGGSEPENGGSGGRTTGIAGSRAIAGEAGGGEQSGGAQGGGQPTSGGRSAEGGDGGDSASPASRIVVGCRAQPLMLGAAAIPEQAEPQIVWTGSAFAVGWVAPDGYEIKITDGAGISNTLKLPALPEAADPQLFWTGFELELYYALEESVYVDTVGKVEGRLAVVNTELVGVGASFRAVMTEPGKVAVVTNTALFLDGKTVETRIYGVRMLGWNGQYFLYSSVLGHGQWNLNRLNIDGSTPGTPIELEWTGIDGTGRGAGSYFASSASSGRHAIVVAASGELTFAVEGSPTFEREMLEEDADASVFSAGEHYLVLLANGPMSDGAPQRDVSVLAFTKDGALVSDTGMPSVISAHAADERFPVGVASDDGSFGTAWVQDGQLVVQRCSVVFR